MKPEIINPWNLNEKQFAELWMKANELSRDFWLIPDDIEIGFEIAELDNNQSDGQVCNDAFYRKAMMKFPYQLLTEEEDHIWRVVIHEFAHLALFEFDRVQDYFPEDLVFRLVSGAMDVAHENTTHRLERIFLSHHPYESVFAKD